MRACTDLYRLVQTCTHFSVGALKSNSNINKLEWEITLALGLALDIPINCERLRLTDANSQHLIVIGFSERFICTLDCCV